MGCYFAWLLMLCLEGNRRRYSCFCFFILFGRFCSWFGWSLLLAFLIGPFSFGLACFFSWKGMRTFVKCRLFGLFYSYLEKIDQSLCFPLNLQYNFSFAHTLSFPQSHAFFPSSSSPEKPFLPASSRTSPSYLHLWYKYHFYSHSYPSSYHHHYSPSNKFFLHTNAFLLSLSYSPTPPHTAVS